VLAPLSSSLKEAPPAFVEDDSQVKWLLSVTLIDDMFRRGSTTMRRNVTWWNDVKQQRIIENSLLTAALLMKQTKHDHKVNTH